MTKVLLREEDIVEKFIKSSGPGGQHVNKTSSCVYLKHIPTGIEVKCQRERSQAANRYVARKMLLEKVEAYKFNKAFIKRQNIEKLKRQSRRKPKNLKVKILNQKRLHSRKKALRLKSIGLD